MIAPIPIHTYTEILADIRKNPGSPDTDLATIMRHRALLESAPNDHAHTYLHHLVEARFCLLYAVRNPGLPGPLNMLEDHLRKAGYRNGKLAMPHMIGTSRKQLREFRQQANQAA